MKYIHLIARFKEAESPPESSWTEEFNLDPDEFRYITGNISHWDDLPDDEKAQKFAEFYGMHIVVEFNNHLTGLEAPREFVGVELAEMLDVPDFERAEDEDDDDDDNDDDDPDNDEDIPGAFKFIDDDEIYQPIETEEE